MNIGAKTMKNDFKMELGISYVKQVPRNKTVAKVLDRLNKADRNNIWTVSEDDLFGLFRSYTMSKHPRDGSAVEKMKFQKNAKELIQYMCGKIAVLEEINRINDLAEADRTEKEKIEREEKEKASKLKDDAKYQELCTSFVFDEADIENISLDECEKELDLKSLYGCLRSLPAATRSDSTGVNFCSLEITSRYVRSRISDDYKSYMLYRALIDGVVITTQKFEYFFSDEENGDGRNIPNIYKEEFASYVLLVQRHVLRKKREEKKQKEIEISQRLKKVIENVRKNGC